MTAMRANPTLTLWLVAAFGSLGLGAPGLAAAQTPSPSDGAPVVEQELYAYTLRHQPARDAFEFVQRMLSAEGKISLRSGTRTLEIRDSPEVIEQVGAFLRSFDHPPLTVRFELLIVQAITLPVSPQPQDSSEIPAELVSEWRKVLAYQSYRLLARAELEPRENEEVTYEMADGYRVSFRLGTLLANRRIKLHNLRLARGDTRGKTSAERELIHTTLTPWVGRPMTLGIPQSDADRTALMLVVICHSPSLWGPRLLAVEGGGRGEQR